MIHTSVCDVLDITHPIVLAGMGSATNAELVAAVSSAGGLGTLACTWRDDAVDEIRRVHSMTNRPFSVNFVLHKTQEENFRACLAEHVPVFTFFRGDPAEPTARAHDTGALVINQITTVAEAEYACKVGVDVLIAQGNEAGGHMGPMPLWNFLPEVVKVAGSRPVLAAGGIVDGQGLAAALSFGAAGIVMGTRFIATPECPAWEVHKQAILDAQVGSTIASGVFDALGDGLWPGGIQVRTLRNRLTARWAGHEDELLGSLEAVRAQREQAEANKDTESMLLLTGEGAGRIHEIKPAGEIVRDVVAEAEAIVRRLYGNID